MAKKILFISHDASRTGAPILLLNFLKWLKANTDIPFKILLVRGGELEHEFGNIAPTFVFLRQECQTGLLGKILKHLIRSINRIRINFMYSDTGLIYSNTVVNGDVLGYLSSIGCPVICHVHELECAIKSFGGSFDKVKLYTTQYIACSEAARDNLIKNHAIPVSKIEMIHGFISFSEIKIKYNRNEICDQLGIPRNARIVCASGTPEWCKAPDIFIQLARLVSRQLKETVYFIWVGSNIIGDNFCILANDVKKCGLEARVLFIGAKTNPFDYFAICDVFALVSREDSFPIVCLEAAYLGKPIVCFDGSGGAKEFVEDDAGFTVPYLDIETMAARVADLLNSPQLRERLGRRAEQKVRERHDIGLLGPRILGVIKKFLI